MRLIYYSLANSPDPARERQWIQSIRSLRRFNGAIPVWLLLFNGASPVLLDEAARLGVTVHHLGDYREFLCRFHVRGAALALYPTFHKFLALDRVPAHAAAQILYLDCDTFFFGDAARLFELYGGADWFAREEPSTRRSSFDYDPLHVDEDLLARIAHHEGARPVIPFNSGICLLSKRVWERLGRLRMNFLDLAWRLLAGRELCDGPRGDCDPEIRSATLDAINGIDRARALPYPSRNGWIIEQIALWLTLGHLPDFSQGFLSREHVVQGSEFHGLGASGRACIVAHYYSTLESNFFAKIGAL